MASVARLRGDPSVGGFLTRLAPVLRESLAYAWRAYLRVIAIVLPTYAGVILLKHSPVLPWIVERMEPAMRWFGLPGEAALVFVLGATINLYAAIAACAGLSFSAGEATTLALMLGLSHNLIVEGALLLRLSRYGAWWLALRIAVAIAVGLVLGPLFAAQWPDLALATGASAGPSAPPPTLLQELLSGSLRYAVILFAIILPIVALLHVLQSYGALARLRTPLRPVLRFLGLSDGASEALIAGVFFGMVYGAGVILDRVQAEGLDEAQVGRLCVQLVLCHAIVEDTLLFIPVGAILWPIVLVRVALALGVGVLLRGFPRARETSARPA